MIDMTLIVQSLPALLRGTLITLQITFASLLIGLLLGVVLAYMEKSSYFFISYLTKGYVALFRGTPLLVQILFVYYVLPQFGICMSGILSAILAFGLNSAAYISQIVGAGIKSVSKGQVEAAITLGLSQMQILRYVVLPQAFLTMLPTLASELSTLIKESSLASVIGVMELSKEASLIRSRTYDAFSLLLASAVIYFILTTTLACLVQVMQKRWGTHARSLQPA